MRGLTLPVPTLSVIVPAHNEAGCLPALISEARDSLTDLCERWELIVVDDGSTDSTEACLASLLRPRPWLRVVRHPARRGYGAALRTGFAAARGDLLFFTDADRQFELREIRRLMVHAGSFDLVIGYRGRRADPLHRRLYARAWGGLVGTLFGLEVRDVDCAFKLFHRHLLERVTLRASGAFINAELLCRAQAEGLRITQVEVSHRPRRSGRATGGEPRVIATALAEVIGLRRELRALQRGDGSTRPRRSAARAASLARTSR